MEAAGGDQPRRGVGRHAVSRALLRGRDDGVVLGVPGPFEAAEQAHERGDDAPPVAAADRLDRSDALAVQLSLPHDRALSCSARASGVSVSPKSSMPNNGRISMSDSPVMGFGQRRTHSMASASEATFQIQ